MNRCLLLFSGGLDSILTAKILKKEKIKITLICFKSYFFNCKLAKRSAKKLGLKLNVIDFSKEHLKIIKEPRYGYGKGMNPCVDCHLLMIKTAKKMMEKYKCNFLATGEVVGERPFSQNKEVLLKMEKEADLEGMILRPLSAKILPETIPENKKWAERKGLYGIQGKSRKPHIALAVKLGVKKFPSPAGGCVLTESEYAKKLKELLRKISTVDGLDCQILRKGRVFWVNKYLVIVGRNEKDNKELIKFKKQGDVILEPKNFPGPTVLIRSFGKEIKKEIKEKSKKLLLKYSKKLVKSPKIHSPR